MGEDDTLDGLRARVAELERSQRLLWALEQASVAMAGSLELDEVLPAVGDTLSVLGVTTVVLRVDDDGQRLRLAYLSAESSLVDMLERVVGMRRDRFSVDVDSVDFYRRILRERQVEFIEDTRTIAAQVLRWAPSSAISFVLSQLGMAQMIGAPLVVGDRSWGAMILSSKQLSRDDRSAIRVFVHQVGWALHKAELMAQLRARVGQVQEAERMLLQSQKMDALGQFTGGIAHDLNNLLTAITMSHELARIGLEDGSDIGPELDTIGDTTRRASELIRKLLAFSREQVLERRPTLLSDVIVGLGPLLRRVLGEDVRLEIDPGPSEEPWLVLVDVAQMEQVVVNLAVNARDALTKGGRLQLICRHVGSDDEVPDDLPPEARGEELVCLSVVDSGHGIAEEALPLIFDPFFTTKGLGRGTGLGLSVVHGIVRQHGGWLTVETAAGVGTSFHVWMPRAAEGTAPPVPRARPPLVPASRVGGLEVLVVEDDAAIGRALVRMLSARQHHVRLVRSVEAARLAPGEGPLSLVISDVVLPDGNGTELCRELQDHLPGLGVVLMSGYSDRRVDTERMEARGWVFLQKPFGAVELEAAIEQAVERAGPPSA